MNDRGRGILSDWNADDDAIAEAMGHAISDALREHRRAGVSIAVWDWDQERVVITPPEEIVVADDAAVEATTGVERDGS